MSDNFNPVTTCIAVTPYDANGDGIWSPVQNRKDCIEGAGVSPWHTLDGRRMVTPSQKGIFINKGKKVVVR